MGGAGGITLLKISYSDFELGVTVPAPGSYIAVAEYDDMTKSYGYGPVLQPVCWWMEDDRYTATATALFSRWKSRS